MTIIQKTNGSQCVTKRRDTRAKEQVAATKSNRKTFAMTRLFWHTMAAYMRSLRVWRARLSPLLLAAVFPCASHGAGSSDNVLLQYHFAGATQMARSPHVAAASRIFAMRSTAAYENLVLNRLALATAAYFGFNVDNQLPRLLGPLLNDLLHVESVGCIGAPQGKSLDFVLAVKLGQTRSLTWQNNLIGLMHNPGTQLSLEGYAGRQWLASRPGGVWLVPAGDWLLLGKGEALPDVRSAYLQSIKKTGQPTNALAEKSFSANIDWPRLTAWKWLDACPLKLGRTQIDITPMAGSLYMSCIISYPESISWQAQPWQIPTKLVREPLISFATGQDVEPFLKSNETIQGLNTDPFRSQFFFWSMGEMPLQSYMAWPDDSPAATVQTLAPQAREAFNPSLKALNGSSLVWDAKGGKLIWTKLPLAAPQLQAAPEKDGHYIVAGLFPSTPGRGAAPEALWDQFIHRTDLIYYDWELTGPRLLELVTATQMLPILQALGIGTDAMHETKTPGFLPVADRLTLQEQWFSSLVPMLGNTATSAAKTGPAEVTIMRTSPFVFSSLELVLLSHVLTDTPAGPVDMSLMPQPKISSSSLPHH
jgi:hypothetical protein